MPWTLPAARPPWLLSASILTAPNVERQTPRATLGSICCGGGALLWLASDPLWLELELELDVADPAAAAHAATTAATRASFPTLIAPSIPASARSSQGDSRGGATRRSPPPRHRGGLCARHLAAARVQRAAVIVRRGVVDF